ncbi:MAG: pre-peptidase C-terminal domain-containing protein, partial [Acidobacteria bacterium]|nr:pre-peptidase C-terminal domain-containing protein [Acidobacteriota bacterium]
MSIHFHNKGILMNFTKKAACVFLVVGSIILLFCNLIVSADTKISSLRQDNVNDKLYSEINSFSLKTSTTPLGQKILNLAISKIDPKIIYASTPHGIFKSLDQTKSWIPLLNQPPFGKIVGLMVAGNNPNLVFGFTKSPNNNLLFVTRDGGENWKVSVDPIFKNSLEPMCATSNDEALYIAADKVIYKSLDNGQTWVAFFPTGLTASIRLLVFDPKTSKNLYVVDKENKILKSIDDGVSWQVLSKVNTKHKITSLAIDPFNPNTLYIGLNKRGGLYYSQDGGNKWLPLVGKLANTSITAIAIDKQTYSLYVSTKKRLFVIDINPQACTTTPITSGQIINGNLQNDDCKSMDRGNSFFADRYTFSGQAGQRIDILITEANFDTFLILYSPTNNRIASDDDNGVGNLARLSFTLPTTGTYTFEVTSSSSSGTGTYSVRTNIGCLAAPSQSGQIINGSLTGDECKPMTESD